MTKLHRLFSSKKCVSSSSPSSGTKILVSADIIASIPTVETKPRSSAFRKIVLQEWSLAKLASLEVLEPVRYYSVLDFHSCRFHRSTQNVRIVAAIGEKPHNSTFLEAGESFKLERGNGLRCHSEHSQKQLFTEQGGTERTSRPTNNVGPFFKSLSLER